jgi:hypothetical protein
MAGLGVFLSTGKGEIRAGRRIDRQQVEVALLGLQKDGELEGFRRLHGEQGERVFGGEARHHRVAYGDGRRDRRYPVRRVGRLPAAGEQPEEHGGRS